MDHSGGDTPAAGQMDTFGQSLSDELWVQLVRGAVQPASLGKLGHYELIEEIARGSQGIVYRALDTRTNRTVAIKRLGWGQFATRNQQKRFERELEATIGLRHPGIVVIHEYEVIGGQPVLAMEWVSGQTIDHWAWRGIKQERRELSGLLRAFHEVCSAVQHAHQRGVIHRDLKPGNILVDSNDAPHVLDFGLALFSPSAASGERITATSEFVGTPAYAAPEQVRIDHDAIDVRTDVYALGMLLYEMLSGRVPFSEDRGLAALFDAIREQDPAPPSRWRHDVDADLDSIVLKAISKDRAGRYQSVDALSADVRRYQASEPVEARRSQRGYALRKGLRRHRRPLIAAGAVVGLLAGWALTLSMMYVRQARMLSEVTAARTESDRVQATLHRLLASVTELGKGAGLEIRREVLEKAAQSADAELQGSPAAWATVEDAIGRTFQQLALYDEAERSVRAALDVRVGLYGREHPDVATSLTHLGRVLRDRAQVSAAEPLFTEALEIRRRVLGERHPAVAESLFDLGMAQQSRGEYAAAVETHRKALDMQLELFGASHPDVALSHSGLGYAHFARRDYAAAEQQFCEALTLRIRLHGEDHRDAAGAKIDLGKVYFETGRIDEAETLIRSALTTFRGLFGQRHDNTAWAAHRLGVVLTAKGRLTEAESLLREALATYRDTLGNDTIYPAFVLESLADLARQRHMIDEARTLLREAERILRTLPQQEAAVSRVRARLSSLTAEGS